MDGSQILLVIAAYVVPIGVLWFVIKTAVLSALRQHDRQRVRRP